MKELRTEIEINASTARVWDTLMDFESFPVWNPFIKTITGESREGARLTICISPPGAKPMTFKPKVIRVQSGREFRWSGQLMMPGIFDGEHIFELEALATQRTKFVHRECFRGLLVPFLWKQLDCQTRQGFEQMNQSLKQRVELN